MDIDIMKESSIEYCENIYALANTYLKSNNNMLLKSMIKELVMLEDNIRVCDNLETLNNYKVLLDQLIIRIEGIINE